MTSLRKIVFALMLSSTAAKEAAGSWHKNGDKSKDCEYGEPASTEAR